MALLLTVPVNGSPGERAYARADKGARGPVAIAPDDLITQQPAGNSAQDRAACTAVATIAPVIAPVSTPVVTAAIVTIPAIIAVDAIMAITAIIRSEEHTSELQSLMRISYAVFCLTK